MIVVLGFLAVVMGVAALIKVFSVCSRVDDLRKEVEALKKWTASLPTTEELARKVPLTRPPAPNFILHIPMQYLSTHYGYAYTVGVADGRFDWPQVAYLFECRGH